MDSFPVQYKSIEESAQLLPQPLEGVIEKINETVKEFFKQHNYGKSDTKDFMVHCRSSVEKFVFSKLYDHIHDMYKVKNSALDRKYLAKREIIKDYSFRQLLKLLVIPKECIPSESTCNRFAQILAGIEKSNSPREKVRDVMRMYSELQVAMSDLTNSTNKLKNKEGTSKLFAYLLAICSLTAPAAEFSLLRDYLSLQEKQRSSEQLVIANFQVLAQRTVGELNASGEHLQLTMHWDNCLF